MVNILLLNKYTGIITQFIEGKETVRQYFSLSHKDLTTFGVNDLPRKVKINFFLPY